MIDYVCCHIFLASICLHLANQMQVKDNPLTCKYKDDRKSCNFCHEVTTAEAELAAEWVLFSITAFAVQSNRDHKLISYVAFELSLTTTHLGTRGLEIDAVS